MPVDFDGTDDQITISNGAGIQISSGNCTFSVWFNADTYTSYNCVFDRGVGANGRDFSFFVNTANDGYYALGNTDGDDWTASGVNTGQWNHVVIRKVSTTTDCWINGAQIESDSGQGGTGDAGGNFSIGGNPSGGGSPFDGKVSEFAGWNTDLSDAQIIQLYSARIKGIPLQIAPANLKIYLPLDDQPEGTSGDGDTFRDLSGNGTNGTGNDGANNTGLTMFSEQVLSYQPSAIYVHAATAATASTTFIQSRMLVGMGM